MELDRSRSRRRKIGPAALAALVATLVALAGWFAGPPQRVDVGAVGDGAFVRGFYEPEALEIGSARWSSPNAALDLPAVSAPAVLAMRLVGRPGGVEVALLVNGAPLAQLGLPGDLVRNYQLLAPADPLGGQTVVELRGPALGGTADPRRLTVLVEQAELAPLSQRGPPPLAVLLPALAALQIGLGLRASGLGRPASWAAAAFAGAALAWGWGWHRQFVAPFLPATIAGAAALALLTLLLRAGARRGAGLRPEALFAVMAATSALVPIYLLLFDYWPAPLRWENLAALLLPLGLAALYAPAPWRRGLAAACLAVAGLYALGMATQVIRSDYGHDFHAIYRGIAAHVKDGAPLYDLARIAENPLADLYKYPPSFALLFYPFALPTFVPALYAWRALSLLMLIVAVWAIWRAYDLRARPWAAAGLALLLLLLKPLPDTLRYGQMDLIVLGLLALGLLALRRGQDLRLGLFIGLAAALKLYPAYLLGLALAQQRWRAIGAAALAGAAAALLSLPAFGWGVWASFLSEVLGATGVGTGWAENQTFNGFLNRLVAPWQIALVPDAGGAVKAATYAWFAAVTALTLWLTRAGGPLRADIGYGLWVTALLLVLPVAWVHYQAILLIPLFQAFVLAEERAGGLPWPAAACYALAWALLAHGNHWTIFDRTLYGPFWALVLSYKFYGILLLYGAAALTIAPAAQPAPQPAPLRSARPRRSRA